MRPLQFPFATAARLMPAGRERDYFVHTARGLDVADAERIIDRALKKDGNATA